MRLLMIAGLMLLSSSVAAGEEPAPEDRMLECLRSLASRDVERQSQAVSTLTSWGDSAVQVLRRMLVAGTLGREQEQQLLSALRLLNSKASMSLALELLMGEHGYARLDIIEDLTGLFRSPDAHAFASRSRELRDWIVKNRGGLDAPRAIKVAASIGGEGIKSLISPCLRDPDLAVRELARVALGVHAGAVTASIPPQYWEGLRTLTPRLLFKSYVASERLSGFPDHGNVTQWFGSGPRLVHGAGGEYTVVDPARPDPKRWIAKSRDVLQFLGGTERYQFVVMSQLDKHTAQWVGSRDKAGVLQWAIGGRQQFVRGACLTYDDAGVSGLAVCLGAERGILGITDSGRQLWRIGETPSVRQLDSHPELPGLIACADGSLVVFRHSESTPVVVARNSEMYTTGVALAPRAREGYGVYCAGRTRQRVPLVALVRPDGGIAWTVLVDSPVVSLRATRMSEGRECIVAATERGYLLVISSEGVVRFAAKLLTHESSLLISMAATHGSAGASGLVSTRSSEELAVWRFR